MAITMTFPIDPIPTIGNPTSKITIAPTPPMIHTVTTEEQLRLVGHKRRLASCTTSSCRCNSTTTLEEQPVTKKPRITPTPTPTTTVQQNKKSVRFGNEYIHVVPRIPQVDMPNVWYSNDELQHSRRCDAHWVHFYSRCDDRYRRELFQVLGTACGKLPPDRDACLALANSPCRGLEREMTPCFRQRKKQVVRNVLQSQQALIAFDDDKVNAERGAEILAEHYHKLALPAARLARLLAQGDALLALQD